MLQLLATAWSFVGYAFLFLVPVLVVSSESRRLLKNVVKSLLDEDSALTPAQAATPVAAPTPATTPAVIQAFTPAAAPAPKPTPVPADPTPAPADPTQAPASTSSSTSPSPKEIAEELKRRIEAGEVSCHSKYFKKAFSSLIRCSLLFTIRFLLSPHRRKWTGNSLCARPQS